MAKNNVRVVEVGMYVGRWWEQFKRW